MALSILPSPLNVPSLFVELEWYLGVKYPRVMDWQDARVVAEAIHQAGLTNRLVAAYNPSHGIRYAVFAPIQLEKGHWVEVQPRHDPAEDLSAGVKAYVLPLPADDVDLDELQRRGWLIVHGGAVDSTVVTLTSPPQLEEIVPLASGILADEATWLAANGTNNVLKPVGVRLPQWKATLAAQRQRAGRMEIAAILLAYGLEPTDPMLAREFRGVGRGLGSLANFLGDDECLYFVSAERHRLLLANMVTVAESARRAQSEPGQVRELTATLALLFQRYFVTA